MAGAFHKLDNVVAIVDYNRIQLDGFVKDIMDVAPLADKWRAFGWHTIEIDGHDIPAIRKALRRKPRPPRASPPAWWPTPSRAKAFRSWRTTPSSTARRPPPDEVKLALQELQ